MNIKKKKNSFFRPALLQFEDRITPSAYVEPNVITANPTTHLLDITYTAHQSSHPLESLVAGVPTSFSTDGFLTYKWQINDTNGTSNDGRLMGDSYPGPTLKVNRGDTLRITLLNELDNLGNLAIASVEDPNTVITEMPLNNHVHGLHLSPNGSSDNVIMTMPAGQGFVYEYKIGQDDQPDGLYWIHPHNHLYSTQEVYRGLSSMLIIGTSDSSIRELAALPERTMSLQYQNLANQGTANQSLVDFIQTKSPLVQQLTINGLVNPTLTVNPGQTEVWTIANMTAQIEANFTLKNSTTGSNLDLIIVAQDGIAYSTPVTIAAGTPITLGTGGRLSFLVTASTTAGQNVQLNFNNNGKGNTFNVNMKSSVSGTGTTLATPTTLTTTGYNPFKDLSTVPAAAIAENRTVTFSIDPVTNGSKAAFKVNGEIFPNPEIFQPRLNTVEEWTLLNTSEVPHPFHYHVNDVQVMSIFVPPGSKNNSGQSNVNSPQLWYQDVINIPAAQLDANGNVLKAGKVVIRIKNLDYTGSFVYHCHILPHEDRGMMGLNTVQPETPIYATGAGAGGGPAVSVYNSLNNSVLNTFFAFESSFTGGVKTAVADVNNDGISDLIVGAGPGGGPRVIVYNGATNFTTTLFDFFAFSTAFSGGVSVAGGDFNADGFADIVVGAGPGGGPQVNIFDGRTGNVLTQFYAYDQSFRGGVTVAVGDVDGSSFNSVVTGAGAGYVGPNNVKTFRNSRFFDIHAARILPGNPSISMNLTGEFMAYEEAYTGGVQVAVGLNSGSKYGGFYRILTGTLTAGPRVQIWEAKENHGITMDTPNVMFKKVADFFAFDSTQTTGVRVGSVAVSKGSDFLAATGSGTSTVVKRFSLLPGATQPTLEEEFSPFTVGFDGGANLGGTY